ncbi:SDR family NAD(P)-dependent oxidoreductase, partial [Pseudoduganella buxea]
LLRSELMGALPAGGAMLALQGPTPRLAALCGQLPAGLEVAAFNSPEALVVAGPQDAIEALARQCDGDGIVPRQLPVSHAFHSAAMAPVLTALTAGAASLRLQAPALPLASNVSGELAGAELALPGYWAQQVRQPVRFEQGVQALARAGHTLFLELGPRPVLSHFVRAAGSQLTALPSLAPGKALATLAGTLAALHVRGADIAWQDVLAHEPVRPTPLPAYPFNRQSYWLAPRRDMAEAGHAAPAAMPVARCHRVVWEAAGGPATVPAASAQPAAWKIVAEPACRVAARLVERMTGAGIRVDRDKPSVDGTDAAHQPVPAQRWAGVVHVFAPAAGAAAGALLRSREALHTLRLAGASTALHLVTLGAQSIGPADDAADPALSAIWGLARGAAQELTAPRLRLADLPPVADMASIDSLLADMLAVAPLAEVAYRAGQRYQPVLQPLALLPAPARPYGDGCMLISGGLGGLALLLAEHLIGAGVRSIALLARRQPDTTETHRIAQWRAAGVSVHLLQADVADRQAVAAALAALRQGGIVVEGLFHLAGTLADRTVDSLDAAHLERVLRPKAEGIEVLCGLLEPAPRFAVLFSSLAAMLGAPAQANYAAANAFLDGYADLLRRRGVRATSIAWGPWGEAGMAARLASNGRNGKVGNVGRLRALASAAALGLVPALATGEATQVMVADLGLLEAQAPVSGAPLPALARALWQGKQAPAPARAAATATSPASQAEKLATMTDRVRVNVAALLGEDEQAIDATLPFERLGLDSLNILQLRNRLNTQFGTDFTAATFYKFSTCAALAAHLLDAAPEPGAAPPFPEAPGAPGAPPATAAAVAADDNDGDGGGDCADAPAQRRALLAKMLEELATLPEALLARVRPAGSVRDATSPTAPAVAEEPSINESINQSLTR